MLFSVDIYPLKAQFLKNEPIKLHLELNNTAEHDVKIKAVIKIVSITRIVEEKCIDIAVQSHKSKSVDVSFSAQDADFRGFGADAEIFENDVSVGTASTAFDVVSDWRKATRYGFLSEFGAAEQNDDDVTSLLKFHINLLQFYDWVYRHDDYIPPQEDYKDLMGKEHSMDVLERKIKKCHGYGMKAIAYGAVYASGSEYFREHQESGLYTSSGEVYRFINIFNIMNISPDSPWHEHIIGEYEKALNTVGFDGIHMDTYGFPKAGISKIDGKSKKVHLDELFPILIKDTRTRLVKSNPDCCLIFNNVCNWPVDTVAAADVDVVYIEVWEPYERYYHIQQLIAAAKYFGSGKPVVLAAYLAPFKEKDHEEEAENAALLLTAAIASNGGYHLLLGEKNGVLTQGYYPDHSVLRDCFVPLMRRYYDFIVRYSEILFDDSLHDVSMTHTGGDNREYIFENGEISPYAQPDKIWAVIREKPSRKVIHFINLTGNSEDYWNKRKKTPIKQQNIKIHAEVLEYPKMVYAVSPDINGCQPQILPFYVEDSERGRIVTAKLPELYFWSTVIIEF